MFWCLYFLLEQKSATDFRSTLHTNSILAQETLVSVFSFSSPFPWPFFLSSPFFPFSTSFNSPSTSSVSFPESEVSKFRRILRKKNINQLLSPLTPLEQPRAKIQQRYIQFWYQSKNYLFSTFTSPVEISTDCFSPLFPELPFSSFWLPLFPHISNWFPPVVLIFPPTYSFPRFSLLSHKHSPRSYQAIAMMCFPFQFNHHRHHHDHHDHHDHHQPFHGSWWISFHCGLGSPVAVETETLLLPLHGRRHARKMFYFHFLCLMSFSPQIKCFKQRCRISAVS